MRIMIATLGAAVLLTACGESGPPIFTRQAGMWKTEMQLLSSMVSPEQRQQMDPSAFAQMQAMMSRPQEIVAPNCVGEQQVDAARLFSLADRAGLAGLACDFTRDERTEMSVLLEGTCQTNDGPTQMKVEINYSPTLVSTTYTSRPPAQPGTASPPEIRFKLIETRTGDCPAEG